MVTYAVLLGGTHFLITLAVYAHSDNLRYFASSGQRIAIYFVAPIALLGIFFVIGYFNLNADRPDASVGFLLYTFFFAVCVRAADYFHVVRQALACCSSSSRRCLRRFHGGRVELTTRSSSVWRAYSC
jgi:NADH:ubiquinone oxidoreductase subunit 4 (subunit M)